MFDFVNPTLAYWGLGLMAVPVVIHLINLMRHRKVDWAAMEFLLESQRRNSTYVMLKQLLLLLMRMAAFAALAMILGQLLLRNEFLGSGPTHHIILLDDSFSMNDRGADGSTVFDKAKLAIERVARRAEEGTQQQFSLLRLSQTQADLQSLPVTVNFTDQLHTMLDTFQTSQLALAPSAGLAELRRILGTARAEKRIVYVVSDFREGDWLSAGEAVKEMTAFNQQKAQLVLVNCVDSVRSNIAITDLKVLAKTRAVDVAVPMEVTLKNFGPDPARQVNITITEDGLPRAERVSIDELAAGATATRRFEVFFRTAGEHRIGARLESDACDTDNIRYQVLDFPIAVPVLLVDGDPSLRDATTVAEMLAPGGAVKTGLAPEIEPPGVLGNRDLSKYKAIYLFNLNFIPEADIEQLEKFAAAGGGICFFVGDKVDSAWINHALYRDGKGLFPAPLSAPAELVVETLERVPDLKILKHPIFEVLSGERNSFISEVFVNRYYALQPDWSPDPKSGTRPICELRNEAPLALESRFGKGRVVTFLTMATGTWSNWGVNPSFIIVMLETQSYLSTPPTREDTRLVGSPIKLELEASEYFDEVALIVPDGAGRGATAPGGGSGSPAGSEGTAPGTTPAAPRSVAGEITEITHAKRDGSKLTVELPTTSAGVYEVRLRRTDETPETRYFAYNVVAEEGDLRAIKREQLDEQLQGVDYQFQQAGSVQDIAGETDERNFSEAFLYLLVLILIGEQILSYFLSFHPGKGGTR